MISERFRQLVAQQLDQFCDCQELVGLGVYVALPAAEGDLQLQLVQAWPLSETRLEPAAEAAPLLTPQQSRRWLPLRRETAVIGALRVDSSQGQWPESLNQRLQSAAQVLAQALLLDLEQQRWQGELQRERRQRDLLVHQMRNPLAALRTFTQLLLRRVEAGDERRELVEHLLDEQQSLAGYLDALAAQRPVWRCPRPAARGAAAAAAGVGASSSRVAQRVFGAADWPALRQWPSFKAGSGIPQDLYRRLRCRRPRWVKLWPTCWKTLFATAIQAGIWGFGSRWSLISCSWRFGIAAHSSMWRNANASFAAASAAAMEPSSRHGLGLGLGPRSPKPAAAA